MIVKDDMVKVEYTLQRVSFMRKCIQNAKEVNDICNTVFEVGQAFREL